MQIIATENYIELIRASLAAVDRDSDPSAIVRALECARHGMNELLARHVSLLTALRKHTEHGLMLANELASIIRNLSPDGEAFAAAVAEQDLPIDADFDLVVCVQNQLSQLIQRGADIGRDSAAINGELSTWLRRAAQWEYDYHTARSAAIRDIPRRPEHEAQESCLTRERLEHLIRSRVKGARNAEISNLRMISGGMGKNTYLCDLKIDTNQLRQLVIRKELANPIADKGSLALVNEFTMFRPLFEAGLPVPEPLVENFDLSLTDTPYIVMPMIAGVVPANFFAPLIEIPGSVFSDVADYLAALHRIPIDRFQEFIRRTGSTSVMDEDVEACYQRNIAEWQSYALRSGVFPSLTLSFVFDWLNRNIPDDHRPPVLTHGDANLHNWLVHDGRVSAFLDWELADFGAPEQDIGYVRRQIEELTNWDEFLRRYEFAAGREIRRADLNFYIVYQYMRLMVTSLCAMKRFASMSSQDGRLIEVDLLYLPLVMGVIMTHTTS